MNQKIIIGAVLALIVLGVVAWWYNSGLKNNNPANNIQVIGGPDEHGCIAGAGYTWCETKNKCLQPWVEKCE